MISLRLPSATQLGKFLQSQENQSFTYQPLRQTAQAIRVAHYDNDQLRVRIGHGDTDFNNAKIAIQRWQMFPRTWTRILPGTPPIQENTTVVMCARFLGIWWRNACRIIYIIDQPNRYGFAYGTLPAHMESGEELFLVFKDENDEVWYEIKAYSRPRHWLAKLAYPLMRLLQARFRRDSAQQMGDVESE